MAHQPGAMGGKRAEMAEDVPSLINSITGSGSVDSKGFDGATAMDEDLVGDDVKILNYTIVFTKRDAEAVLQTDREEIVDYPTDEASFAGLKVAEFLGALSGTASRGLRTGWSLRATDTRPWASRSGRFRRVTESSSWSA